jgi:hypothetical protein
MVKHVSLDLGPSLSFGFITKRNGTIYLVCSHLIDRKCMGVFNLL